MVNLIVIGGLLWLGAALAQAGTGPAAAPDKRGYDLFHPVPHDLLRELSTDRPDKTESPYSVDAGHVQIEMDLVSYVHDRDQSGGDDVQTDAFAVVPFNLKVGLLNQVDLQVVIESYNHVRVHDRTTGTVKTMSGFGDITTRLKVNFWGDDGGRTAFAMMPFVKSPSNQDGLGNDSVEGGVIFPLAVELPGGWGLGLMTEVDCLRNATGPGHQASFINSITASHDLIGRLSGYVEFFSEVGTERGAPWVGTVDVGLTYGVTENVQLDAGINLGVTQSADDLNPFIGLSVRF